MKKLLMLGALALLAAAVTAGTASAATPVSLASCALYGGTRTVPAGSDLLLRTGWLAAKQGLTTAFVNDVTTGLEIDGVPVDASYGPVFQRADGNWEADYVYALGPVTGPTVVTFTETLAHPIPDLLTFVDGGHRPYLFDGTILDGSCTLVPGS